MSTLQRALAATELLLLLPAAAFMSALFARNLQPPQYEPAHTAGRLVAWYAGHPRTGLWLLLIALPLAALLTGCAATWRKWKDDATLRSAARSVLTAIRAHAPTLIVAVATLMAGGILAIVALHMLTG